MVSVRQRSVDFPVRYAIVDSDRQGVTGPSNCVKTFEIYNIKYLGGEDEYIHIKSYENDSHNFFRMFTTFKKYYFAALGIQCRKIVILLAERYLNVLRYILYNIHCIAIKQIHCLWRHWI